MTFDEFWELYPRRVAKKAARTAWAKVNMNEVIATSIYENIQARLQSGDWHLNRKQYIPHPATYLNGERWNDEVLTHDYQNQQYSTSGRSSAVDRVKANTARKREERAAGASGDFDRNAMGEDGGNVRLQVYEPIRRDSGCNMG